MKYNKMQQSMVELPPVRGSIIREEEPWKFIGLTNAIKRRKYMEMKS